MTKTQILKSIQLVLNKSGTEDHAWLSPVDRLSRFHTYKYGTPRAQEFRRWPATRAHNMHLHANNNGKSARTVLGNNKNKHTDKGLSVSQNNYDRFPLSCLSTSSQNRWPYVYKYVVYKILWLQSNHTHVWTINICLLNKYLPKFLSSPELCHNAPDAVLIYYTLSVQNARLRTESSRQLANSI